MKPNLHATVALLLTALVLAAPAAAAPSETDARARAQATESDGVTTGSIGPSREERVKRRFDDCMEIWEPATHMTKSQWRRTCQNQLDEIPNL